MADSLRELIITLKVDGAQQAKAALDGLDKAMNGTAKSAKDLDSSVSKAGQGLTVFGAFVASVAANAFTSIASSIANVGVSIAKNIIGEAAEAELIFKKLESAVLTAGLSLDEVVPQVERLADEMARTTQFTDDEIKALSAYALSLGATTKQIKEIIPVAADFAVRTGKDLKMAVEGFTKSLQGNAGPLQRLQPDLKDMSEEALRAGGALKFFKNQMGGAARAEVETFSGQMIQLKKNIADTFETLGMPIINYLGPLFKDINALIGPYTNSPILTNFMQGFVDTIENIAVFMYDFYLFLRGEESFIGLTLNIDQKAPIFEKLMASFQAFFLLLAQKSGEWAIPVGIEIAKGIMNGLMSGLMSAFMAFDKWLYDQIGNTKVIKFLFPDTPSKYPNQKEETFFPKIERSDYIGPYSQSYFPRTEKTIPSDTLQQFQGAPRGQGSSINQDIKMYVSGDTAVDALSRQLKSTMNTFKTNVVA